MSFYIDAGSCSTLLFVTLLLYLLNVVIFNEIHLRRKREQVNRAVIFTYYIFYKVMLVLINVASVYW